MKKWQRVQVLDNHSIAPGIYSMVLQYPPEDTPMEIRPGQFVGVYCADGSRLLPRPISICSWKYMDVAGTSDRDALQAACIRLVYRVSGKGTKELSQLSENDEVNVLGILGNGYDLSLLEGKRVLLIGGGIGAPPLLGLAQELAGADEQDTGNRGLQGRTQVTAVLGYRTSELFLKDDFEQVGEVIVATDDGSAGVHGTVIDAVHQTLSTAGGAFPWDVICSCGPLPMLRGVRQLAREYHVPCYISMEERMACGVGACLGCVTRTTHQDAHSKVNNARVCTEGPVFNAEDVEL